jgi:hypothetical protein
MPTVSGMLNTDAMNFIECLKCHRPAGKVCHDHRGKKLSIVRPERAKEYQGKFKDRADLYKDALTRLQRKKAPDDSST